MSSRISTGNDLGAGKRSISEAAGCAGVVSDRFGESAPPETSLLSPFILSRNFLRTRCGMSNKSEVGRICLFEPRTGDGLRLHTREVDDPANDGILRGGAFDDNVIARGEPSDSWGDKGPPSDEYRL